MASKRIRQTNLEMVGDLLFLCCKFEDGGKPMEMQLRWVNGRWVSLVSFES